MPKGVTKVDGGWNVFVSDKSFHISASKKSQVYAMPKNLGKEIKAISIFGGLNVPIE
jgi:acetate kinase